MSFFSDLLGGGGDEKQTVTTTPSSIPISYASPFGFNLTTSGGSQLQAGSAGGFVKAPAQIGTLNTRFGNLTDNALGRTGGYINDLRGNMNPFIQARVRPLETDIATKRGMLDRNLSRRGIAGSLANNELMNFDNNANRQLADARATATNEALSALYQAEGLDRSVRGDLLTAADTLLKQELTTLGLSLEGLNLALSGAQRRATDVAGGTSTTRTSGASDFGSTLRGIGQIIAATQGVPVA